MNRGEQGMAGASMSSARDEHKVLACLDPAYDPMCVWQARRARRAVPRVVTGEGVPCSAAGGGTWYRSIRLSSKRPAPTANGTASLLHRYPRVDDPLQACFSRTCALVCALTTAGACSRLLCVLPSGVESAAGSTGRATGARPTGGMCARGGVGAAASRVRPGLCGLRPVALSPPHDAQHARN
jgi:hypothetical protein